MSLDDLQPGGNSFHADKKPKLLELPNEVLAGLSNLGTFALT